jgi:hypothetical protein
MLKFLSVNSIITNIMNLKLSTNTGDLKKIKRVKKID